ncbi:MAG: hypothetical protein U5L45_16725 [Saprospiraceae bacterium]|nr:hypothetical protein [Saprospiraceae bacterium]
MTKANNGDDKRHDTTMTTVDAGDEKDGSENVAADALAALATPAADALVDAVAEALGDARISNAEQIVAADGDQPRKQTSAMKIWLPLRRVIIALTGRRTTGK